ncbi:MAG: hypothetical protein AMS27_09575 [Bacteroides sp. SM23_62_1]|nr:MAG: hypothetical protein AMS27_09575 [Bacteroides sp. SM23_62_1]
MTDILLVGFGSALMILGLLGCILPVIPGPPLSFIGLIVLHFTKFADFSYTFFLLWGSVAIIVTVLDYVVPIWGTKKFGGSKSGMWGAGIGLVVGLFFFPPLGIIIGPFAGAVIGEAITGKDTKASFRAGLGSFLGLLMGVGIKLAASVMMTFYFIREFFR